MTSGNAATPRRTRRRTSFAKSTTGASRTLIHVSGNPGWRSDRWRIYIVRGPPDEIESHPSGGTYELPPEEGGSTAGAYPFEEWRHLLPLADLAPGSYMLKVTVVDKIRNHRSSAPFTVTGRPVSKKS